MLAELDPSLFQSNVDQSAAKVNNAKAAYNKAKANLEYKRNNYQRYEHLYNKKQSSPHCIPNQNDSFKNFDELNFLTKIGK